MKEQDPEKMLSACLLRTYLAFSSRAQQSNSKALKIRKFVPCAERLLRLTCQPRYLSQEHEKGQIRKGEDRTVPLRNEQLLYSHTFLRSGRTSLHSHHQCRRVSFSLRPLQQLLFAAFFDESPSDWCEVMCRAVLFCISLITSKAGLPCVRLLAICMFFWRKVSFRPSAYFSLSNKVCILTSF